MDFLKSFISKFPSLYIIFKSPNLKIAKSNIKAYNLIKKHNLFDKDFYLKEYKQIKNLKTDPILHYIFFGFEEGKDPSKDFDSLFYLNEYEDAKKNRLNPLVHYSLYGLNNNRKTKLEANKISSMGSNEINEFLAQNYTNFGFENTKKRVLYIIHEKINTLGGTGYINQDIINEMNKEYETYILSSNKNQLELWKYSSERLEKLANWNVNLIKPSIIHDYNNENLDNDLEKYFYNKKLRDIYFNVIYDLKIDFIHINHLINHSYDLIDMAKFFNIPYILNIHDFYYFCPSIHLLNDENKYCKVKCRKNDWTCNIGQNLEELIMTWRKLSIKAINFSNLSIFPSEFSLNFYKNNFKEINTEKLTIIAPGRDFKNSFKSFKEPDEYPVKILFPGHISPHKGSLLIKDLKKLDKNNNFEFHFLGTSIPPLKEYGINHGRYDREDIGQYFNNIKPSFIGLFSICPETYSHTLTESWNYNIPVIGTNLGALKERINDTNGGWIVDYESPKKIYDEIIKIIENKDNYLNIVENISKIKFKSRKKMFLEYKKIYNNLIND